MKYIVILGDGMADEPIDALGGKTPLACAETHVMDELASKGEMGMVQNVPTGMAPGSDVANLSVLGYDPAVCYSGRSPLEALSVGVAMEPTDIVLRCNIVTLTEEEPYAEKTILDHSSGEISTADADILMESLSKGDQEKVQLVLVMSRRAKLYLLDEPIGGVDPAARDYILNTIITNYDPSATVLISTHLIADVERVLDEYLFLSQGRILQGGNVDAVREETGKSLDELFREVFKCLPNC